MGTIFYASERYWQRSKEDAIANRLMDEMVPRAQAVDPSLQGPADAIAADMPGLGTGGVDELRMRFGMAEQAKLINSAACDVICVGLHAFRLRGVRAFVNLKNLQNGDPRRCALSFGPTASLFSA